MTIYKYTTLLKSERQENLWSLQQVLQSKDIRR